MSKLYFTVFFLLLSDFVFANSLIDVNTPKTVVADKIILDMNTGIAKTQGKTVLSTDTGQTLTLYDASVSKDLSLAKVDDVEIYLSNSVRINADKIEKEKEITKFLDINYTACADKSDPNKVCAWEIGASRLLHDSIDKELYFHNSVFYAYSMPILYLPWLAYPDPTVKRKTGFLFPIFASGNRLGYQAEIPFYIAISDYHDLTVSPIFFTKQNPLLKLEHRLNLKHSSFRSVGSYIRTKEHENRWHIFNEDVIELGNHMRLLGSFNKTSDKTYLQEYHFSHSDPYLDSFLRFEAFSEQSYLFAEGHSFQELRLSSNSNNITTNADIIPSAHAVVQTTPVVGESFFKFWGDFLTLDYRDSDTFNSRLIGEARYILPLTLPFGQRLELSPSFRYDLYFLNKASLLNGDDKFTGQKSRILPSGYALWKWPFMKYSGKIFQIVEPRFRYVLKNKSDSNNIINQDAMGTYLNDTNLFADQRFSGYDLWDTGSYIDYGVNYMLFDEKNRGLELFLGEAYDFYEPIDLDSNSGYRKGFSDYVGRLTFRPIDKLSVFYRYRLDEVDFKLKHSEFGASIVDEKNYFNIEYISNKKFDDFLDEVNQSEIYSNFSFEILHNINWYSSIRYNIEDKYLQNISSGLTYNHPCYTIGFLYKNDRAVKGDYRGSHGFQFRFSLKITGDMKNSSNQLINLENWE